MGRNATKNGTMNGTAIETPTVPSVNINGPAVVASVVGLTSSLTDDALGKLDESSLLDILGSIAVAENSADITTAIAIGHVCAFVVDGRVCRSTDEATRRDHFTDGTNAARDRYNAVRVGKRKIATMQECLHLYHASKLIPDILKCEKITHAKVLMRLASRDETPDRWNDPVSYSIHPAYVTPDASGQTKLNAIVKAALADGATEATVKAAVNAANGVTVAEPVKKTADPLKLAEKEAERIAKLLTERSIDSARFFRMLESHLLANGYQYTIPTK